MLKVKINDFVQFHIARVITGLFKRYLVITEDLLEDQKTFLAKVKEVCPREKHAEIDAANRFDDERFLRIRKRVLDAGNEARKEIEASLQKILE